MSTISAERAEFSQRLLAALASGRGLGGSPTALAREFNQFFSGKDITVHAARKWLMGEAIPTQDKLQALARWLDVSVDWLRFGSDGTAAAPFGQTASQGPGNGVGMDALLRLYMGLPQRDRAMAKQFIAMLANQPKRENARPAHFPETVTLA